MFLDDTACNLASLNLMKFASGARVSITMRSEPGRRSAPRSYGPEVPSPLSCTCASTWSVGLVKPVQVRAPVVTRAATPVSARWYSPSCPPPNGRVSMSLSCTQSKPRSTRTASWRETPASRRRSLASPKIGYVACSSGS